MYYLNYANLITVMLRMTFFIISVYSLEFGVWSAWSALEY